MMLKDSRKIKSVASRLLYQFKKYIYPPIYIFQMGKVGSSSLERTLKRIGKGEIIHAHSYANMNPCQKRMLKFRLLFRLPILVVCPIRDPVSRNISAFFQNFKRDTGFEFFNRKWQTSELRELFLDKYRHNICIEWFDRHLRTTFGINVFERDFPADKKWKIYRQNSVRLLVYRSDLEQSKQLSIVSNFLKFRIESWDYSNISKEKSYSTLYQDFCSTVKLPKIYVKVLVESQFSRLFWTEKEIQEIIQKWV